MNLMTKLTLACLKAFAISCIIVSTYCLIFNK